MSGNMHASASPSRTPRILIPLIATVCLLTETAPRSAYGADERLRVLIETDAGGDPDDEQSLVRFLLYTNEWDVEGIIANRPVARDGENLNPERTGHGVVTRLVKAYGECFPKLKQHDPRYPEPDELLKRTVAGYGDREDGVELILKVVDREDPRPVWYADWGSDRGSDVNMKRALDRVLKERGPEGYAKFKSRLRIVGYDQFGDHTTKIEPPFPFWVNTFQPPVDGKRWYHRFSGITGTAGGFDIGRDLLSDHGPLAEKYPTNTTHPQKEGDTMTFLYLVPTGMNDPDQPMWGSWAGRYGRHEDFPALQAYWANQPDQWNGSRHRDNSLIRWAAHLQNDFKARLDWCVQDRSGANHPPVARLEVKSLQQNASALGSVEQGIIRIDGKSGEKLSVDAGRSSDPDRDDLKYEWIYYPEAGGYRGPPAKVEEPGQAMTQITLPTVESASELHFVLAATDSGEPPLTRYCRLIVDVQP